MSESELEVYEAVKSIAAVTAVGSVGMGAIAILAGNPVLLLNLMDIMQITAYF